MNKKIFALLFFILVLVVSLQAISFTQNPAITPTDTLRTPTTEDDLVCTWTPSGDMWQQNTSWYNGSNLYNYTMNDSDNQVTLLAGIAKKGEIWTCNVTIMNSTGNTSIQATQVTIKNALPTPPNATDETLYEDQTTIIPLNSTDPDGDSLTYHMEDGIPTYCSIVQATGVVTCTPDVDDIGEQNVSFYVKDGGIDWPNANVTYTVEEVNDAPSFTLTNQTAIEGTPFYYNFTVTDEENHWPINFTLSSSLGTINITNTSNNTASISFTSGDNAPIFTDAGVWLITVNITDSGPSADTPYDTPLASQSFYLNVTTVNQLPNITTNFTGYPSNGTQGANYVINVTANDTDVSDTLLFSITSNCSLTNPWNITTLDSTYENATGQVNLTLTNDHVICNWVNISVFDGEAYDWQILELNITNTNDAPTLHEISNEEINTGTNISNLTTVKGATFIYQVNVTDPDENTYEGEIFTYSDNSTNNITINSTTGIISFVATTAELGNHTINITVSDDEGLTSSRTLHIEVKNNTAPYLQNLSVYSCAEDALCTIFVNAVDPDPGEDLIITSNNTNIFPITDVNETSYVLSYTPTNDQVGTYLVNVTVEDQYSFTDSLIFNFTINNTNDAPIFDQDQDNVSDNISFPIIVEDYLFAYQIYVTDEDLYIGLDNLSYNFTYITEIGNLSNDTSIIQEGENYFTISFLPTTDHIGVHEINISVTDNSSVTTWQALNFTVYAKTNTPGVEEIRPYWNTTQNNTVFSFANASLFPTRIVNVNSTENTAIIFDAIITNDSSAANNSLTYTWYVDNVEQTSLAQVNPGTNSSYTLTLDYFDQGNKTILLEAQDARYTTVNWTWNLNISDINRPPVINNNIPNLTVNKSSTFTDFMSHFTNASGWQQLFYDPDDDLDSNGQRGESTAENTSLTYSITPGFGCSLATITFSQDTLSITPTDEGVCIIKMRATDPYDAYVDSNLVYITITEIDVIEVDNPVSSGGGESTPRSVPFPFEVEVDSPVPIELLSPGQVLTYVDEAVEIPLTLKNTWEDTITGISLNASIPNATFEANFSFSDNYFTSLAEDESREIILTIDGYRQEEPFNVKVQANVEDPDYVDSVIIMVNAMERRDDGEDVESKITFARDLLNENPECQELNELLNKAEEEQANGNAAEALKLIDSAMNGCKYLINEQKEAETESPKSFFALLTVTPKQLPAIIIGGVLVLILFAFGIMMLFSGRKKLDI